MAKKSAIEKNNRRKRLVRQYAARRARLLEIANNRDLPMEERFQARLALAKLPRNASPVRVKNRCDVTGRPRGYHRKLAMSRVALRDLASEGKIPGMVKSSW
jgi:small subunit ribosomal protein S14